MWGFPNPMQLFINIQFFIIFSLTIEAQILRYFLNFRKCAYESLLQHRNILRKNEKRFCEVLRIRCTFSLNIQFFIIFGLTFGPGFWDIFSISGNAFMNHFFSIVISCEKAKNGSVRFCGSDATFSLKIQFFIIFGLILGPDFEIFSQFQEIPLWITASAS